jgi:signal transduction histidine kinase
MYTLESATERHNAMLAEVQLQVEERCHDIIGIIQHEFRTPMTLLLGYGEYLRESLNGQIDREELSLSIDAILSGSYRLNRLIESFLFLSDLQHRRQSQLKVQPVEPGILWREVQAILRVEAEESGLRVENMNPENVPSIEVDPELTRGALTRLFDNALRYVRSDSRRIRLCVEFDEQWVRWIIEDEGPGMEASQVQRILEPFARSHGASYRPERANLSLAIVRRIAELHGGTLEVESWVDQGSRFCLSMPLSPRSVS